MQLIQLSPTDLARVQALPGVKVESKAGPGIILMAMALDQPQFKDKRVHQAVLHAIDREGIVKQVLAGQAPTLYSGGGLPRLDPDIIEEIIHRDSLALLGLD